MSAYSNGRPSHIVSLPTSPNRDLSPGPEQREQQSEAGANTNAVEGVYEKLEAFLGATKQVELSLQNERNRVKQLQEDLKNANLLYDRLLKESDIRNRELVVNEGKLKSALVDQQDYIKKQNNHIRDIHNELKKVKGQVAQYQCGWAELLQRENEARLIIAEGEKYRTRTSALEEHVQKLAQQLQHEKAAREQAEKHLKSYQLELQAALQRIQVTESKFTNLNNEYRFLYQAKQKLEEDFAKAGKSMEDRFQWGIAKEREKLKAHFEKEVSNERERIKEEYKKNIQAQIDREIATERQQLAAHVNHLEHDNSKLSTELAQLKETLGQLEKQNNDSSIRIQVEMEQLQAQLKRDRLEFESQLESEREKRKAEGEQRVVREIRILELQEELRELGDQLSDAAQDVESLQALLVKEKQQALKAIQVLLLQNEEDRANNPATRLLQKIIADIQELQNHYDQKNLSSQERERVAEMVRALVVQRNAIEGVLEELHARFDLQKAALERLADSNTLMTTTA